MYILYVILVVHLSVRLNIRPRHCS